MRIVLLCYVAVTAGLTKDDDDKGSMEIGDLGGRSQLVRRRLMEDTVADALPSRPPALPPWQYPADQFASLPTVTPFPPFPFQTLPTPTPFTMPPLLFVPPPPKPLTPANQFNQFNQLPLPQQNAFLPSDDGNSTIPPAKISPEALMTVPELIEYWGYPVEVHQVVTKDGYILTLHRIPHGRNDTSKAGRPVVFLQHGLLCTSSIWLLNLPSQSAGFVFADAGFDVWLGNVRGNSYSKEHSVLSNNSPEYWHFSWEEMARYDIPAMVDKALQVSGQPNLYYVGHSQGTLTMFAKQAEDPEFHKKIRKFFALAPVGRLAHVKGLFYYLGKMYNQMKLFYGIFGDNEFLASNIFTQILTEMICEADKGNPLCSNFIFSVSGPDSQQFNTSRIGIYLAHNPAGTSGRNMLHYAQMAHEGKMNMFDNGVEDSQRRWGKPSPPELSLATVKSPVYLFYSDSDWLANDVDVEGFLIPSLPPGSLKMSKRLRDFNHNDFLWGLRATKEIYEPIASMIKLDRRRLAIQIGMRKYFEGRPANISDDIRQQFLSTLNTTLDFD